MHMILDVKKRCLFIFLESPVSESRVQGQASSDTAESSVPIPPYEQTVPQLQEVSVNYEGADQHPCSSLRTSSHRLLWQAALVVH